MVTYNNIIDYFKNFADNHFFIQSFSHGNLEEADLQKYGNYPLMHVNYTGSTYDENEVYSFEVYVLGLPPDKLDKLAFQKEVVSDSKQCLEDLLADIKLTENVFNTEIFDIVSASMTPLEEETKNVLSGMVLDLSFQIPHTYDGCDAPLTGVTPTPSGDCLPVRVVNSTESYDVNVSSGGTLVLSDNTVTDVNGTTRDVPAQTDVVCEWTAFNVVNTSGDICVAVDSFPLVDPVLPKVNVTDVNGTQRTEAACVDVVCAWQPLEVRNSENTVVANVPSYPSGANILLNDITLDEVDGSTVSKPSGVDLECSWFDITIKDQNDNTLDTLTTYPTGGEVEVTIPEVENTCNIIYHREPSYSSASTGDYPNLYNSGYFAKYAPTGAVNMRRLGANPYVLHADTPNPFGTTARYTSTDGTASDTGTARFSSYGTGVTDVVIDWLFDIIWKATPESGTNSINNAQAKIDALNTANFAGINTWISPTRDMYTLSANPDSNVDIHTSPNLIIDTGTRRYVTSERYPSVSSGWIVLNWGGEGYQSLTSTISSSTYTVAAAILSDAQIAAIIA